MDTSNICLIDDYFIRNIEMIISQTTDSIPSYTIFEYQADRKAVDYVHFCKSDIFSYLRC